MTNRTRNHLDNAIESSRFEFGDYISRGFDIWKEEAWLYIVFAILLMVISFVLGIIPIVGPLANQLFITPILTAGAFIFSHKLANRQRPEFNTFFKGSDHAGRIIGLNALYALIFLVLVLPLFIFMGLNLDVLSGDEEAILELARSLSPFLLLSFIPFLIVALAFAYSTHFIIFYDLSIVDSIKYSTKIFFRHPFILIIYFIIIGLIAVSGIIGFCIGIIITSSMIYPMLYMAFRHITKLAEYESGDSDNDVYNTLVEVF